jgi:peptide chain release factor 2
LQSELKILNEKITAANFWDDTKYANTIIAQKNKIENQLSTLLSASSDLQSIIELANEEITDADEQIITTELENLANKTHQIKIQTLFTKPEDNMSTYLEIHAGAGGTESCDWASMLLRLYVRFCERKNWTVSVLEMEDGDVAGIKSATIQIDGIDAFGWLKTERGIHRLVRISPFNAAGKRQTSFASVWIYPVIDDTIKIEILDKDLKIDTYRASGAGGQHVNKTDSAIRITHLPTKIVVACQTERSQHQNRAIAMAMLKSRLYELEQSKQDAAKNADNANKTEIGWGNQIRSYVLQPYKMVKDQRTGVETSDTAAVLDGNIDIFLGQVELYKN